MAERLANDSDCVWIRLENAHDWK